VEERFKDLHHKHSSTLSEDRHFQERPSRPFCQNLTWSPVTPYSSESPLRDASDCQHFSAATREPFTRDDKFIRLFVLIYVARIRTHLFKIIDLYVNHADLKIYAHHSFQLLLLASTKFCLLAI